MSGIDAAVCSCGHTGWAHGIVSFAEPDARGGCHHHVKGRLACRCEAFTPDAPVTATLTGEPLTVVTTRRSLHTPRAPQSVAQAAGDRITRARTFAASWAHLAAWIATGDTEDLTAAIDTLTDAARRPRK